MRPRDKVVSELIGTLLLIAITVILMTTLGVFLFANIPTGSATVPQVDFKVTKDSLNYSNEYLISVNSVTENIPVDAISMDFIVSGASSSVVIPLNGSHTYYFYPVLMQMESYSGLGHAIPVKYFNASIQMRLYIPDQFKLTYVEIIDKKVNSVIGDNSISGASISNPTLSSFPWLEQSLFYNISSPPSIEQVNSTSISGAVCNESNIVQSYSIKSQLIEFNSSRFQKTDQSSVFWSNNTTNRPRYNPFEFSQLESISDYSKGNGLKLVTNIFVNSTRMLNISLCTSEPVFLRIYNSTTVITPFNNKTSNSYTNLYTTEPTLFNAKILLHKGSYFVDIYYFYENQNGIIAVNIPY